MAANVITIDGIKEVTTPIFSDYPVERAILFGSYAENKASEHSDIDLYIDTNGKLKGLDFVGLLDALVNALGMGIDLIDKSHIEPGSPIIHEIESKGMIIYEAS